MILDESIGLAALIVIIGILVITVSFGMMMECKSVEVESDVVAQVCKFPWQDKWVVN